MASQVLAPDSPLYRRRHAHFGRARTSRRASIMERPSVRSQTQGAVTTLILDRPDRRNAIDRPTGKALAEAFRAFERDKTARVAVLWGDNGTFCAGADLKAVAAGPKKRKIGYGEGPMGPTRMLLTKPVLGAISGYAV